MAALLPLDESAEARDGSGREWLPGEAECAAAPERQALAEEGRSALRQRDDARRRGSVGRRASCDRSCTTRSSASRRQEPLC